MKEKWYFQSLRETKSVKATDDWAVEISWYASTKDKDRWWDIVEPKAFQSALERYMTNPIVLLQHKTDKPIGIVEEADIDDNWLYIKAKISQNTDWVIDLIKNWVLRAFSIWYSVKDYETDVRELADWTIDLTNIIKDLELYEISVVSVPMNPYALSKSVEDLFEVEETEDEETKCEDCWDKEDTEEKPYKAEDDEDVPLDIEAVVPGTEQAEENNDEKSVETVDSNENSSEESSEWTDVQEEEKVDESETEETTESEEIVEETKSEEIEERPNEEVETEETCEEEVEKNDSEEVVEEKADENSEIVDEEEVDEDSENDVETTSNEDEVVETHNDEIVETKSIETESQKQFDFESKFAMLSKSFDEKLAEKDEKIKSLESKVEKMTQLFADSLDTIDRMTVAIKNTPVNSGLQYKRPLKKWWYYDIASIIKTL